MNIGFDCPHCGLSMEASIDNNGGTVQCVGCGKEFVVDASEPVAPVLPVVKARAVSTPVAANPLPHPPPRTPQPHHRPGPAPHPQGRDRARFEAPVKKKSSFEEYMPFYGLGAMLVLLIGLGVWLFSADSKPKKTDRTTHSSASIDPQLAKLNEKLDTIEKERIAKEEADREKIAEQARIEREKQDKIQKDIAILEQKQYDEVTDAIARAAFDGNTTVAEACLQAWKNVLLGLNSLQNDSDPSNDPKSDRELNEYVVKGLTTQFNSNAILRKWTEEHQTNLETFVPELVRKIDPRFRSIASANNFDFSKYRSTGSGFFISADGWILTNEHVVSGSKQVDIRLRDGKILRAKVVRADATNDLALLKAELDSPACLAVTKGTVDLKLGRTVFTVGYPDPMLLGLEPKFTNGRVSAASGIGDRKDSYQTTVPVQHGNSGGALVDFATGWVVGVVNSRLESRGGISADNVSYAIKANVVSTFLESVAEAKAAAAATPPKTFPKGEENPVIDFATEASVLILCPR